MCAVVLVGIDVSAASFESCLLEPGRHVAKAASHANTVEGRQRFIGQLEKLMRRGDQVRVCLESTGVYSVDLSWALSQTEAVEVMVVNPRAMSQFRGAVSQRNKTDREDAELALEFLQRMPFELWKAPSNESMVLRQLARRIEDLVGLSTQEKCRLHAATSVEMAPAFIRRDIAEHLEELERRIGKLRQQALELIASSGELNRRLQLLTSIKGIGEASGIKILAELSILPSGLRAKQWVAWAGLDPSRYESGTSVKRGPRISRQGSHHLRHALYLPAVTAARFEPGVKTFYEELLAKGKASAVAHVAVMRKLLHSINGMWKQNLPFENDKFRAPKA